MSLECTDGMFGDKCSKACGYCKDMSQCNHVDGTCINGCQPGYTSKLCKQRAFILLCIFFLI